MLNKNFRVFDTRPSGLEPRPTPLVLATAGWVAAPILRSRRVGRGPNGPFTAAVGRRWNPTAAKVGRGSNFPLRPKKSDPLGRRYKSTSAKVGVVFRPPPKTPNPRGLQVEIGFTPSLLP